MVVGKEATNSRHSHCPRTRPALLAVQHLDSHQCSLLQQPTRRRQHHQRTLVGVVGVVGLVVVTMHHHHMVDQHLSIMVVVDQVVSA